MKRINKAKNEKSVRWHLNHVKRFRFIFKYLVLIKRVGNGF